MVLYPCRMNLLQCRGVYVLQGEKNSGCPFRGSRDESFSLFGGCVEKHFCTLKGISETGKADICLSIDNSLPDEAYTLEVSSDRINISSNETAAGFFYGVQSLLQLMPVAIYDGDRKYEGKIRILLSALRMLPVSLIVGL